MISYKFEFNQAEVAKLEKLTEFIVYEVTDKALAAAAKPIIQKAKAIAPDSITSGSRARWGKNKTEHFDPQKWAQHSSGNHIGRRNKKTKWGAMMWVGAQWSEGIKQQYNHPLSEERKQYYWGKPGQAIETVSRSGRRYSYIKKGEGEVWRFPKERWFMKQAYDETVPAQMSAAISTVEQEIERIQL